MLFRSVTAFIELRLLQLLQDPGRFDPLEASSLTPAQLARLADANDRAAALDSLDAVLRHWRDGREIRCRDWLNSELEALAPLALAQGLQPWLSPLAELIGRGNTAMRWLALHRAGQSVAEIVAASALELQRREEALKASLATDPSPALG